MSPVVDRDAFLDAMARSWKLYENTGSDAMTAAWALLVDTFNTRAAGQSDRAAVFAGPLGSGKTLGAITYTAMMPPDAGALIVTRRIAQAVEVADAINARGGRAFAYHSDLPVDVWNNTDALVDWPVVVACHRTYETGLNMAAFAEVDPRFAKLHAYQDGRTRALVIVDEAMPQILEARVTAQTIHRLREALPPGVALYNREAMLALVGVEQLLMTDRDASRPLSDEELGRWLYASTTEADEALVRLGAGVQAFGGFKRDKRAKVRRIIDALTAVRTLMEDTRWQYVGRSKKTMLTTARMLVPPARSVTLDATGALSPVHVGRPDLFEIIEPAPTRSYWPVTVRVARTPRGTGKEPMERFVAPITKGVLASLQKHYGAHARDRRVLFVTHKVAEARVLALVTRAGFAAAHVAHWNALDGRNDWRDCDTIVILSHPYRDPAADVNAVRAISGTNAAPADILDGTRAIKEARVAAANAQALGRTQMRKMLSATGECPPVDVWMRAPAARRPIDTDAVLAAIARTLPGLRFESWDLDEGADTDDARRRGAKGDAVLLGIAAGLTVGQSAALSMGLLGVTNGAKSRLLLAARTAGNPLQVKLARLGCVVTPGKPVGFATWVPPTLTKVNADSMVAERPVRARLGRGQRGKKKA